MLVHSPDSPNGWAGPWPELGACNAIRMPHVSGRGPMTEAISPAPPGWGLY